MPEAAASEDRFRWLIAPSERRNSLHTEVCVRQRDRFPVNMSYHYFAT
jgi:type IV secretory pathway VirD2 relaxase